MKLGDNMTMEACNVWSDVAPRKCRPPRIGDIPKHGAVDEESPSSSSRKLALSPSDAVPLDSSLPLDTPTAIAPETRNIQQQLLPSGKVKGPILPYFNSVESRQLADKPPQIAENIIGNLTPIYQKELKTRKANIDPAITISLSRTDELAKLKNTQSPPDVQDSSRLPSSPEDNSDGGEIQEVRKDSALFLEEAEGLPTFRENLKPHAPRIVRPRRESSGYASNLSTFDEERRNSSTNDVQQDLSLLLKENRKSSAKRPNSRIPVSKTEEHLDEQTQIGTLERMPTTEINRKVSSAGLDMPNIEEVKEVLKEETASRQENIESPYKSAETVAVDQLSARCQLPREANNQTYSPRTDIAAPSIEVAPSTFYDSAPSRIVPKEPLDTSSLKKELHRISCETILHEEPIISSKDRKIRETPSRFSREPPCTVAHARNEIARGNTCARLEEKNAGEIFRDKDNPPRSPEYGKALPKPVKVYQLLSTQSEDRGDGVPYLTDRRISLQIPEHEENEVLASGSCVPEDKSPQRASNISTSCGSASSENVQDTRSERAAPLPATADIPGRKLSSSGDASSQRFLGDAGNVTVRPIYPYCPYSPYGSPQGSPRNRRRPLRESRRVSIDNRQGALQLNQYKLLDNIGQGSYGIVKLAYNEEEESHYAMKILSKKKLMKKAGIFGRMAPGRKSAADPLAKVYREIALLKKLDHPNVVKLVEVLDDPEEDNLYLVFELVQRGEILQIPTDKPLDEETARRNFRDVVMGVEYLHYQRIVHRDIKPSNLLVDSEGRIKIADLGVSAELRTSGELLSGPAGTPAFAAPETTTPGAYYSGTQCDVWSMGVTLYSLVTGKVPWDGSGSIIGVQAAARSEPLKFPEKPHLSDNVRDVISRMLAKNPTERITLTEIKEHMWLTNEGIEPLPCETDNCRLPVTVTDEEVERVVTRVPKLDTLILIKTMLKQHSFQNPFLPKRMGRTTCNDTESGGLEMPSATGRTGISSQHRGAMRNAKAERFHRTGRSNSAPDSYDWHTNGRQISVESALPPVTEVSNQETEIERR